MNTPQATVYAAGCPGVAEGNNSGTGRTSRCTTVAAIDAPGRGDRPRSAADDQARADLRRALGAGEPLDEIFESFIGPLVEKTAPDWRTALDALLSLPGIGGPVGYSGWTAVGIHLAVVEPRIAAAGFFAGGYVPRAQREEARQVTIPLLFLPQWDDEGNPRSGHWTCSMPSAPRRRRCTPIWAGTPASRGSRWRTEAASSAGT